MSNHVRATGDAADQALHKVDQAAWFMKVVSIVGVVTIFAAVLTFGLINIGQQNTARAHTMVILKRVLDATDPNSQLSKQAAAQQNLVVKNLILCLENHEDRLAAKEAGHRLPKAMPGCP